MQTEYIYPDLGDRTSPKEWLELGKPDLLEKAIIKKNEILSKNSPGALDAALTVKFGQHLIFIYKFSKSNSGKPLIWRAMKYLFLVAAVLSETIGTSALQASNQFTKFWPSVTVVISYAVAFYFLSITLNTSQLVSLMHFGLVWE